MRGALLVLASAAGACAVHLRGAGEEGHRGLLPPQAVLACVAEEAACDAIPNCKACAAKPGAIPPFPAGPLGVYKSCQELNTWWLSIDFDDPIACTPFAYELGQTPLVQLLFCKYDVAAFYSQLEGCKIPVTAGGTVAPTAAPGASEAPTAGGGGVSAAPTTAPVPAQPLPTPGVTTAQSPPPPLATVPAATEPAATAEGTTPAPPLPPV